MKKFIAVLLCTVLCFSVIGFNVEAVADDFSPYVASFNLITEVSTSAIYENETRATGLIYYYNLVLKKSGTTLQLVGQTSCTADVVKCGYKNLVVERRKSSSDSWEEYYDYGNVYVEAATANLNTTLVVASGYQYRISCKHYAKKSLLLTQTISNTSGIVTVS